MRDKEIFCEMCQTAAIGLTFVPNLWISQVEIHRSILNCSLRNTNLYNCTPDGQARGSHAGGLGRTQTSLEVSFFHGDCHVYPHLDEVPVRELPGQAGPRACQPAHLLSCRSVLTSSPERWGVVGLERTARGRVRASPLVGSRAGHLRARSQNYYPGITTSHYIITTSSLHHYFGITWPLLRHYYKLIFRYYVLLRNYYPSITTYYFLITTLLLHDYFTITNHYYTITT
jgi:hypothetical protein